MKSSRNILIMLVGFVVMAVLVAGPSGRLSAPTEQPAEPLIAELNPESGLISDEDILNQLREVNRIFPGMDDENIAAINLLDPVSQVSLTLTRSDAGWEDVDTGQILEDDLGYILSETVAILPFITIFDNVEPEQYPEFGLSRDLALLFINVIMSSGETHVVAIGDLSPDEVGHYALVDDRPDLYIVERAPIAYLAVILRQVQDARN